MEKKHILIMKDVFILLLAGCVFVWLYCGFCMALKNAIIIEDNFTNKIINSYK